LTSCCSNISPADTVTGELGVNSTVANHGVSQNSVISQDILELSSHRVISSGLYAREYENSVIFSIVLLLE